MRKEITIKHKGKSVSAFYTVTGNTLRVLLPDGSTRVTILNGSDCESAAETHLHFYLKEPNHS